jgi:hypothetical protein
MRPTAVAKPVSTRRSESEAESTTVTRCKVAWTTDRNAAHPLNLVRLELHLGTTTVCYCGLNLTS